MQVDRQAERLVPLFGSDAGRCGMQCCGGTVTVRTGATHLKYNLPCEQRYEPATGELLQSSRAGELQFYEGHICWVEAPSSMLEAPRGGARRLQVEYRQILRHISGAIGSGDDALAREEARERCATFGSILFAIPV